MKAPLAWGYDDFLLDSDLSLLALVSVIQL